MALKQKTIKLDNGDDKGKTFLLTEMPLLEADRWAWKLGHGMLKGGIDASGIDLNAMDLKTSGGILEFAKVGVAALGNIEQDTLFDLLDELTTKCIKIIPASGVPRNLVFGDGEFTENDISSAKTLNYLRMEAVKLHINFLAQGDS